MNKCETCKHRGENIKVRSVNEDERPSAFYACNRIVRSKSFGGGVTPEDTAPAIIIDISSPYEKFCVKLDFGCVLWEQK